MKKFLALFLVLVMAFTCILVSCNKDAEDEPEDTDDDSFGGAFYTGTTGTGTGIGTGTASQTGKTHTDFTWEEDSEGKLIYIRAAELYIRSDTNLLDETKEATAVFGESFKRIKYNKEWTQIEYNGKECYVKTSYITDDPGSVIFTDDAEPTTVYVTQDKLFLRTSTLYKVGENSYTNNIGHTVKAGVELTRVATSENGMWIRVEYQGEEFYCNTDYTSTTAPGESTDGGSDSAPAVPEG